MSIGKVLVANRGEIAVRIARACRELGILSVMVCSEADRGALHTRSGDVAVPIGPAPAAESYLCADKLIEVARSQGCDAVHPGYGFLSENAEFARLITEAGLIWIGPSPDAITLMGSKIASKRLAVANGVPVVPGYFGDDQSLAKLTEEAARIGYPVLIKASAGGGGKGMRSVEASSEFEEALDGARREAMAAFGDDAVMLEKYLAKPRHIEVQVLGDLYGNLIHLGERDCSIQRRHQKVVEECPSPVIDEVLRSKITSAATALARAAGYTNAGTVEFIFQDGAFYFLEMNTRIQVEHPVTEEATGFDLVQVQIRIASGEPLSINQSSISLDKHAIEARIYAEDPSTGFLPSIGTIARWEMPARGNNVRLDTGVEKGSTVSSFYDPMLAKVIVSGHTREEALSHLDAALVEMQVEGLATNIPFLRWLAANASFRGGNYSTRLIDEEYTGRAHTPDVPTALLLAVAVAEAHPTYALREAAQSNEIWRASSWRQGFQAIPLSFLVNDQTFKVTLTAQPGVSSQWTALVESQDQILFKGDAIVDFPPRGAFSRGDSALALPVSLDRGNSFQTVRLGPGTLANGLKSEMAGMAHFVRLSGPPTTAAVRKLVSAAGDNTLQSPMPGKVLRVHVTEGSEVTENQPLVIIEAMKMEFTVRAPQDGLIAKVLHQEGDQVVVGDILIEMNQ